MKSEFISSERKLFEIRNSLFSAQLLSADYIISIMGYGASIYKFSSNEFRRGDIKIFNNFIDKCCWSLINSEIFRYWSLTHEYWE